MAKQRHRHGRDREVRERARSPSPRVRERGVSAARRIAANPSSAQSHHSDVRPASIHKLSSAVDESTSHHRRRSTSRHRHTHDLDDRHSHHKPPTSRHTAERDTSKHDRQRSTSATARADRYIPNASHDRSEHRRRSPDRESRYTRRHHDSSRQHSVDARHAERTDNRKDRERDYWIHHEADYRRRSIDRHSAHTERSPARHVAAVRHSRHSSRQEASFHDTQTRRRTSLSPRDQHRRERSRARATPTRSTERSDSHRRHSRLNRSPDRDLNKPSRPRQRSTSSHTSRRRDSDMYPYNGPSGHPYHAQHYSQYGQQMQGYPRPGYPPAFSPHRPPTGMHTPHYPAPAQSPYPSHPQRHAQPSYFPSGPSPTYAAQPPYPQQSPHTTVPPNQRSAGPPNPSKQPTKAPNIPAKPPPTAHFASMSWTPSATTTPAATIVNPAAPIQASNDDDDDDNPFRPPRDMRAEDESDRKASIAKTNGDAKNSTGSPAGLAIKGSATKGGATDIKANEAPVKAAQPVKAVRMVKELVIKRRLKPRPEMSAEHAQSQSIYYRKTGNDSVVGSGTYGKVYKAVHVYTKHEVALKKIRMEGEKDGFPVTAIREIKLLQSINHPNVVALQEVMVENNDCFMIFEYLQHDLTGLLNHPTFVLTDAHKKHLAKQMFEGLDYLHRRGILHRDIKAANILVSKTGQLKFADFGLARFYQKHKKQDHTNRVITIWYRPPELLLGETQYGAAVDIWSAACVLVEIFTRHAIFAGDGSELNQLDKIYSVLGSPSRSVWPSIVELQWYELLRPSVKIPSTFAERYKDRVTPAAFELLSAMFQYDPDKRPTAGEVLEHAYFTSEEPTAAQVVELEHVQGDWHEFESKALRKEKDREERKRREKERLSLSAAGGEKRQATEESKDDKEREHKRLKTQVAPAAS